MMKKPDRKGLQKLRAFIAALPEEAFEWSTFVSSDEHDKDDVVLRHITRHLRTIAKTKRPVCGTSACIAGWATVCHPRRLRLMGHGVVCTPSDTEPRYDDDAFARAYGLSSKQAHRIVYGYEVYEHSREGALQALDDLIGSL